MPNKYYCDYCYYRDKLFLIYEFDYDDIEWNEDDTEDNTGIVRVSHIEPFFMLDLRNQYNNLIDSNDEISIDQEDLPSMTLEESYRSIIMNVFTK